MKWRWAYPSNWNELARACKEEANWQCQECGIVEGAVVVSRRTGVVYTVHLAAAHLNHDIWNPQPQLQALCPRCHRRYDASQRDQWLALEMYRHHWLLECWRKRQATRAMLIELQKGVIERHGRTPPI